MTEGPKADDGPRPGAGAESATGRARRSLGPQRDDRAILLIAAVASTIYLATDIVMGHWRVAGWSTVWLIVVGGLTWWGWSRRARPLPPVLPLIISLCALNYALPLTNQIDQSSSLAALALILLWAGVLLHPAWTVGLGAYAIAGLFVVGVEFAPNISAVEGPGVIALPLLAVWLICPIGIGIGVHTRDELARRTLRHSLEELRDQRSDLARQLESQANELEVSRVHLQQAQKLKTVGTMASGLAHELNNILTPIRGLAELIAQGASVDQGRRYGQRILDSAVAAAQITGALLTYTRQGSYKPVRTNVRQLLRGQILPVLSKSLPSGIRFRLDLEHNVSVDVDRVLFQQCITNLVFNAVDSMPDGGDISIALSTSSRPCRPEDREDGTQRSAVITVADRGGGIAAEHLEQIFDPFFTTKAVGSGTGLGLAMVHGTVTRHGGKVLVDSITGHGSTFTILLPLAASDERNSAEWPVLRGNSAGPVVMVATEDEDALDEFEELLRSTDCSPICTSDAPAVSSLLTELGDRIDLVVLDLDLEAVDSVQLFRKMRELHPDLPAILLSESPTDPAIQRLIGVGPTRSVRKPMDAEVLATLLTDLLNPESADSRTRMVFASSSERVG